MFGIGTQRLINLAIGGLFAMALVITLMAVFGTTQPYRVGYESAATTD